MIRANLRLCLAALAGALMLAAPGAQAEIDIQAVDTPGGLTAWLVEDHTIPFTALEIRFRGGTALDAADKAGATNLMTALLEEGAADMDARAFARARDSLAASFSFDAGTDAVRVSARFLSENREAAVALLRKALIEPRFDAGAIERVRGQVMSKLRSDATDPQRMARNAFDAAVFGNHPYATPGDGTLETVPDLARADIVAAHRGALARDRVYIGAAGDITGDELATLLDDLLGELPETGAPLPGDADPAFDGETRVIDYDTPQSVAVFGQAGVAIDDPDFFAAYIANRILGGGGFESRLMQELREKRGLTYGIGTYLADRDRAKLWMGSLASSNDTMAEAVRLVRAEWARLSREGVTERELEDAKTYLTGAYALRFDGNAPIARIIVGMQMQGLPIDYVKTRNDRIRAVTLDAVNRVATERLDPGALSFTVVGRPAGLDGVRELIAATRDTGTGIVHWRGLPSPCRSLGQARIIQERGQDAKNETPGPVGLAAPRVEQHHAPARGRAPVRRCRPDHRRSRPAALQRGCRGRERRAVQGRGAGRTGRRRRRGPHFHHRVQQGHLRVAEKRARLDQPHQTEPVPRQTHRHHVGHRRSLGRGTRAGDAAQLPGGLPPTVAAGAGNAARRPVKGIRRERPADKRPLPRHADQADGRPQGRNRPRLSPAACPRSWPRLPSRP